MTLGHAEQGGSRAGIAMPLKFSYTLVRLVSIGLITQVSRHLDRRKLAAATAVITQKRHLRVAYYMADGSEDYSASHLSLWLNAPPRS